jgi:hypothetical protein
MVRLHVDAEHLVLERDVLRLLACRSSSGAFGEAISDSSRPRRSRSSAPDRALDEDEVPLGVDRVDLEPTWVTRLPPRRPAMLMPLKTRDGVADAPIEPGLRTLCEPCDVGPRWKLCRLIVPAKPFRARRRSPSPSRRARTPRRDVLADDQLALAAQLEQACRYGAVDLVLLQVARARPS